MTAFLRRRRGRKVTLSLLAACALLVLAYVADTSSDVTLRVAGVVVETATTLHPEFSRFKARTVSIAQSRISIPGKTFWWDNSFSPGDRVDVRFVEGRFTGWRYVTAVEPRE